MNRVRAIFLALSVLFPALSASVQAYAKGSPVVFHTVEAREVTFQDRAKTISIQQGKWLVIRLNENLSNGASWKVTRITGRSLSSSVQHVAKPSGIFSRPGEPGRFVVYLKGTEVGRSTLTILYRKADGGISKRFSLTVDVTP